MPEQVSEPTCAIVAPVRGEAPYLLEWIAYHRVRGVQRFILADNGGDDGTSELLERLDLRRSHHVDRLTITEAGGPP